MPAETLRRPTRMPAEPTDVPEKPSTALQKLKRAFKAPLKLLQGSKDSERTGEVTGPVRNSAVQGNFNPSRVNQRRNSVMSRTHTHTHTQTQWHRSSSSRSSRQTPQAAPDA